MKRFSSLTLNLMIALIVSACGARGAQATPTINPLDLQSTVAAAAFTMIAETQAAIPTATPITPTATLTNTPLPTDTPLGLPPAGVTFTPVSGAGDPCINQVMPATLQGETVKIRLNNSTRAALTVSVNLHQATPQSQCGYRTYQIAAQQPLVINNLVEGCYTIWAWNPEPEDYFIVTNGTSCVNGSDNWVFDISTSSIKLR